MRVAPLLMLLACVDGPAPESVVDELRIVAATADPPEVVVGDPYTLDVVVADPVGDGAEVAAWACDEDVCLQQTAALNDDHVTFDAIGTPAPVWLVACAPDVCDLDLSDDTLRDPTAWLASLPLDGVSAALRPTQLTEEPSEAANPIVESAPDGPIAADRGGSRSLVFQVPGAQTAYGLATLGGFDAASYDVANDGTATLEWLASARPGEGRVYVVFEDDAGGSTVWEADAVSR